MLVKIIYGDIDFGQYAKSIHFISALVITLINHYYDYIMYNIYACL